MEKDTLYSQLINIAEEKSCILAQVEFDPQLARQKSQYLELESKEKELLRQVKEIENEEIISNSYLFAYDQFLLSRDQTRKIK